MRNQPLLQLLYETAGARVAEAETLLHATRCDCIHESNTATLTSLAALHSLLLHEDARHQRLHHALFQTQH